MKIVKPNHMTIAEKESFVSQAPRPRLPNAALARILDVLPVQRMKDNDLIDIMDAMQDGYCLQVSEEKRGTRVKLVLVRHTKKQRDLVHASYLIPRAK